ncbi:MAG: hypothetical protein A3F69_02880 [Acidobacteria bacterium RIFCSPLOWO2_12_FULL_66_10]|nr:MAG: hypothetical protein A3F69_02880 [Acidobacteria bacterium RIFCSPLOWO2_12_FULL_66_10]
MRRVFFDAGLGFAIVPVLVCLAFLQASAQEDEGRGRERKLMNAPPEEVNRPPVLDPYDRLSQVWYRQRVATSGVGRGQEIYYMSCWMCHNEYTIAADKDHAPSLKDLFKAPTPATDEAVVAKIRGGGLRMPAYPASVVTDTDLKDLLSYLRAKCGTFPTGAEGGGGCYDENNPPPNPMYKGG